MYFHIQPSLIGSFGDVLTVYDDNGVQFAIKLFEPSDCSEDHDSDDDSDNDDIDDESVVEQEIHVFDLGTLREISILRLLRHENSHRNIIQIHDLKQSDSVVDEITHNGDDLMSNIGLVMPLYSHGNLSNAIDSSVFTKKKMKVQIAHGILEAVAFLHRNGIIHRDIKGDNIMLDIDERTGDFFPVLIDFSLGKIIEPHVYHIDDDDDEQTDKESRWKATPFIHKIENESTHTPDAGTATYKAPEVLNEQPYDLSADMYSVGVVLLELLMGKTLEATKDRDAIQFISDTVQSRLPDQPFANMIKGLLETNPKQRLSAEDALKNEVFVKFGCRNSDDMMTKSTSSIRLMNMKDALPLDEIDFDDEDESGNIPPSSTTSLSKNITKKRSTKRQSKLRKRLKFIQRIAHILESKNPMTIHAAMTYAEQLSQLEDCDDLQESQGLCDCVILAHQFFEEEVWNLRQIEHLEDGIFKEFEWSLETYADNEESIFVMMDFCLYPRELLDLSNV